VGRVFLSLDGAFELFFPLFPALPYKFLKEKDVKGVCFFFYMVLKKFKVGQS